MVMDLPFMKLVWESALGSEGTQHQTLSEEQQNSESFVV